MSDRPPALILGMSETGLGTLRLLGRAGVVCYGLDAIEPLPAFWSRYCRRGVRLAPDACDAQVVEAVIAFGKDLPPRPVLIPTSDRMVQLVSRARARLEPLFRMVLPDEATVEDLLDKSRFAQRTRGLPMSVPRSMTINGIDELPAAVAELGLPLILKPVRQGDIAGTNFPKVLLLERLEQVAEAQARHACCNNMRLVAQEYIPGAARQQLSVAAVLDRDCRVVTSFTARKRRQGTNGTGVGLYVESIHDPEAETAGIALLKQLKCVGISEVELKRHPETGRLYVIEINARVWLQVTLPAACGINFPEAVYCVAAGIAPPPVPRDAASGPTNAWQDFFHDGHATFRPGGYRAKGDVSVYQWLKESLIARSGPYASLRDPLPLLSRLCHLVAKLAPWNTTKDPSPAAEKKALPAP